MAQRITTWKLNINSFQVEADVRLNIDTSTFIATTREPPLRLTGSDLQQLKQAMIAKLRESLEVTKEKQFYVELHGAGRTQTGWTTDRDWLDDTDHDTADAPIDKRWYRDAATEINWQFQFGTVQIIRVPSGEVKHADHASGTRHSGLPVVGPAGTGFKDNYEPRDASSESNSRIHGYRFLLPHDETSLQMLETLRVTMHQAQQRISHQMDLRDPQAVLLQLTQELAQLMPYPDGMGPAEPEAPPTPDKRPSRRATKVAVPKYPIQELLRNSDPQVPTAHKRTTLRTVPPPTPPQLGK